MKRLIIVITTLLSLVIPATAFAYNPFGSACGSGGGATGSTACSTNGSDPISGPNGALKKISVVLAGVAGVAAVILIIVGGFQYVTSNGDAAKAAGARNTIMGSVIGLVIIVAAESIVLFVVSKL
jgi:hypothetical protein